MTTQLSPLPVFRAWDNLGLPLFGGKLFTYVAGTTTKQATFTDSTGGTPNTNPIILNFRGEANVWLDPTKVYKLVLAPANDTDPPTNPFWTVDQISGGSLSPTGSIIPTVDNLFTLGSTSFSWANVYVGPNHAPVLDTTSGNIGYYARTQAEITAAVLPTNFSYPPGNVLRYGADSTGVVDSSAAFLQARQVATQGGIELAIPGGTYKISSTLQWGFASLRVKAYGKVTLSFPALVGQCVAVDGGAGGGGVNDVSITGEIRVVGNAFTTDAWFVRACHRSNLTMRAGDCIAGLRINWSVATKFNFVCSVNEASFSALTPSAGIILDQRGTGETTAGCLFEDTIVEGITGGSGVGLDFQHTLNNIFIGGTSEGNKIGARVSGTDNAGNIISCMDMESNTVNDVIYNGGNGFVFDNCNIASLLAGFNIDVVSGCGLVFQAGYVRLINLQLDNAVEFFGTQVANGGGVGIQPNGHSYKCVGVDLVDGSRNFIDHMPDLVGESNVFVPTISGGTTPGAQTYAANGQKGYYTRVGHVIFFSIYLLLTANSGGTGVAVIGGLPRPSRNVVNGFQSIAIADYTGVTLGGAGRTLGMRIGPASVTGVLLETDTGSVNNSILIGAIGATANLVINGSYLID